MKKPQLVLVQWFPHGNQGETVEIGVFAMEVEIGIQTLTTQNGCESQYLIERECRTVELIGKTWLLSPSSNDYSDVNWELSLAADNGREFLAQLCPHCKRFISK